MKHHQADRVHRQVGWYHCQLMVGQMVCRTDSCHLMLCWHHWWLLAAILGIKVWLHVGTIHLLRRFTSITSKKICPLFQVLFYGVGAKPPEVHFAPLPFSSGKIFDEDPTSN